MLGLIVIGTVGYFFTEALQRHLQQLNKHVKLTFMDAINSSLQSRNEDPFTRARTPPWRLDSSYGSAAGSVYNISGSFESSI